MAELKAQKNSASVEEFIESVDDELKRKDCYELLKIFKDATGEEPAMWGTSIVGYGSYHYKSERSAQEGDWPLTGFSPRKQSLTIYIMPGFNSYKEQVAKLGKVKTSVSCIYIKRLADVDSDVLKEIVKDSTQKMREDFK